MADTLNNVQLPAGVWVDLYDATGIAVGTQINAKNEGTSSVMLVAIATEPQDLSPDGFRTYNPGDEAINDSGDSGAWALSKTRDGLLNIKEVV